jgi:phosphatidylglycerophosphate synthase
VSVIGVRNGLVLGLLSLVVLLSALSAGVPGWTIGLACGVGLAIATAAAAATGGVDRLGPADLVTVTRATLACGVAALVADAFVAGPTAGPSAAVVAGLAGVALALDWVDGRVARWTGTASAYGARLDGEADAFLILVLSLYVARSAGAWVVAMGAARYLFAVAGWLLPWMRAQLPPRYWRKVVAAVAGTALAIAAADAGRGAVSTAALVVAALLLAESFGRDVWWLRSRRAAEMQASARDVDEVRPQRQPT